MKYLILIIFWILWCFLHSFFVSTKTTTWFKKYLGNKFAYFRIFYNLLSLITVLPLLYWQRRMGGSVIIELPLYLLYLKYLAKILGAILVAWAFRFFDTMEFLGLRKGVQEKPVISKHGLYGIVRHPMYLGGFIYLTAAATDAPLAQFLGYFILAVYMLIGTVREDKRLANELGKIYRDYQKEVPMFLPRFILKKRLTGSRDKG